jgi:HAD superfamily hydrolase (TIGR01493 family)
MPISLLPVEQLYQALSRATLEVQAEKHTMINRYEDENIWDQVKGFSMRLVDELGGIHGQHPTYILQHFGLWDNSELGLTTAILSNGSTDMLASAVRSGEMAGALDHVISVDSIRLYKTAPESYALVLKKIPVSKGEVLFVSSNAWDALGATWFGFTTHWVNRQRLPFEALTPHPQYFGEDLHSVLDTLGAGISNTRQVVVA